MLRLGQVAVVAVRGSATNFNRRNRRQLYMTSLQAPAYGTNGRKVAQQNGENVPCCSDNLVPPGKVHWMVELSRCELQLRLDCDLGDGGAGHGQKLNYPESRMKGASRSRNISKFGCLLRLFTTLRWPPPKFAIKPAPLRYGIDIYRDIDTV
jgi:hypothetical protein